ncbi:MAG: FAD-binding oxidoreductase [Dehalococcoidia bacterium]|nr:FAD-binding oxidoreductase [Dehalococcoidia bacterium]
MTSIAARFSINTDDPFNALRAGILGTVVTPDHPDYEEARQVVSIAVDRHPAAIVRCAGTEDVAFTVRFARERGIEIAPRSGAHSGLGHSSIDDAIVIDMGGMRGINIDPVSRTAVVQPGVTSEDLAGPAAAYGLALTTGDTGSVGIGGLTVGGGIGWMARKYGLTIDNLLAATVVTAEGEILRTSVEEHPDLFWAIRGGGGNFGIITDFTFQLAPNGMVHGGVIVLPATPEVLRGYLDYAPEAVDDLTTISFLMAAPPAPFIPEDRIGEIVLLVGVTWTGALDDVAARDAALAPIRALATPIADTVEAIPYPVMFVYTAEGTKRHGAAIRTMFGDDLEDAQIEAVIEAMKAASSPFNMIQIRGMGGAIARVPADATAFAHRDARIMLTVLGIWYDPEDDGATHRAWASSLWEQLAPASRGAYVNFLQDDAEERLPEAYRGVLERLRSVKAQYDPENVFHYNANVRPK